MNLPGPENTIFSESYWSSGAYDDVRIDRCEKVLQVIDDLPASWFSAVSIVELDM
jgi:hypothetical protein